MNLSAASGWNPPGAFIANGVEPATIAAALTAPPPAPRGGGGGGGGRGGGQPPHTPAHYIKVSVQADGTFTVWNSRNNFSKTYAPRPRTTAK